MLARKGAPGLGDNLRQRCGSREFDGSIKTCQQCRCPPALQSKQVPLVNFSEPVVEAGVTSTACSDGTAPVRFPGNHRNYSLAVDSGAGPSACSAADRTLVGTPTQGNSIGPAPAVV